MSTDIATQVAIKIIETTPAVVNFNYHEISDQLDAVLAKYTGLVFTDSTAADCKKTIAELRKGEKALDTFRKSTKASLSESITAFENQCKLLTAKFEDVINPLNAQQEQFEKDRKEKKRAEVQGVIDALVLEKGLSEKYASPLLIQDEYLNKGKTIRSIKADLTAQADTLKGGQESEEQAQELVRAKVELANVQHQLKNPLPADPYISLIQYKSMGEIEALINNDAIKEEAREHVSINTVAPERSDAIAAEVNAFENAVNRTATVPPGYVVNGIDLAGPQRAPMSRPVDQEPTGKITVTYKITGTTGQLEELEAYLDTTKLEWEDL